MKAIVSCSGKFHAFALAEQLQKRDMLAGLYTTYAWQKNRFMRRYAGRKDHENIDSECIRTNIPIAVLLRIARREYRWNEWFDRWVAWSIGSKKDYDVFIGWSGMSLHSIRAARRRGKTTILERGSSHIEYQNSILKEEYLKFGLNFSIDQRVIDKELQEYEACDYISVPSSFVKNTFLEKGVQSEKLIQNPYGAARIFSHLPEQGSSRPFKVLYLGSLVVRKGLIYLFEALDLLQIPEELLEIRFIGHVSDELKPVIDRRRRPNWKFFGHIPQSELPQVIASCDVAVQPSLEEGLSMVIPQMMGCGVPVIATTNTGGMDIIQGGETGFIVPIRAPEAIAEKIMYVYNNPEIHAAMKIKAAASVRERFTWDDYGARYAAFLNNLS